MASDDYPPFQLGRSRFDQSTFSGRLRHFLDVVDPRTLLTREQTLQASVKLLEGYKEGKLGPDVTNKQLWEAQKIKQAILHPDTGHRIPMPFRMSGFAPFGTVTVYHSPFSPHLPHSILPSHSLIFPLSSTLGDGPAPAKPDIVPDDILAGPSPPCAMGAIFRHGDVMISDLRGLTM
jgi:hypothetical protein